MGTRERSAVDHSRLPPPPPRPHMGSKKNRIKQAFAPSPAPNDNDNSVYNSNAIDDDLVDELLTALDSRDATVRRESATVLEEVQTEQVAAQAAPPDKAGSKSRFKARQVRPVHHACAAGVTGLSSREGKRPRSPDSRRPSTPTRMRSSSGRPRMRSARSTGYATSWGSTCTRYRQPPLSTHTYHLFQAHHLRTPFFSRTDQSRWPLSLLSSRRPTGHSQRHPAAGSALQPSPPSGRRLHASAPK